MDIETGDSKEEEVMTMITKATISPNASGFSIPLSKTWSWLGYPTRSEASKCAKRVLTKGLEFVKIRDRCDGVSDIWLNKEGFKNLAMASDTETGRRARWYFLAVEKTLHEIANEDNVQRLTRALSCAQSVEDRLKKLEDKLDELKKG